ncbi:Late expression factor 12 [Trabala vishnou gigantina nucleopolyhedrovirus]|uniref:Late expression factor 12 n=1 Tax=Trabala vishnou gigantina nucleopolyhedrovirus TaxID=2863583 RepID=UPI002481EE0A|nr:Late expression factor 12 [Trabala vishnou gigantina nucleopolyhedrovirus]QYC92725.1 Late expression factor 12 [Trabala vishnou gigantina nucleopolyhedrovirus]
MREHTVDMAKCRAVTVIDDRRLQNNFAHVQSFVAFMRSAVHQMALCGEITHDDAKTLCVADDTAAWICGRIKNCDFVTFRMKSAKFRRSHNNSVLTRLYGFDQSLEQKLLGNDDSRRRNNHYRNLTYTNFSSKLVAVKLIVFCENDDVDITLSNPCPQLAYFIKVDAMLARRSSTPSAMIMSRDCDCFRENTQCVNLTFDLEEFDETNAYHRSLLLQEDLVEEPYDDATIRIVCECKQIKCNNI